MRWLVTPFEFRKSLSKPSELGMFAAAVGGIGVAVAGSSAAASVFAGLLGVGSVVVLGAFAAELLLRLRDRRQASSRIGG